MKRAQNLAHAKAAAEAVKAYLRLHREQVADDAELLSLLLPERFAGQGNVRDFQYYVIEKLRAENAVLAAECDRLKKRAELVSAVREGVRGLTLELISAANFEEVVAIALGAAPALSAERVSLAIECETTLLPGADGIRLIPRGLIDSLIGTDAIGAVLRGNHDSLFGGTLGGLQSVAIFRLGVGVGGPPAVFTVATAADGRFEDEAETREIAFFVRALERMFAAWLDPPRS
ncbi:MAG: DUF484 family protein [Alphaproteobacteria bacterium]